MCDAASMWQSSRTLGWHLVYYACVRFLCDIVAAIGNIVVQIAYLTMSSEN